MSHRLTRVAGLGAACALAAAVGCGGAAAKPNQPPPKAPDVRSPPPPAWIETKRGDFWLAFSDFCWFTACVDFRQPSERTDIPRLVVGRGETVRFHLGFSPSRLSIELGRRTFALEPKRDAAWHVRAAGLAVLMSHGSLGRANFIARFKLTP